MNDETWEALKKDLHNKEYVEKFIAAAVYLVKKENNDSK